MDDTLNITITASENLSSANITLLGYTYTMSTSGMIANASVTVNASHADGQVEFNITTLDLAGNSLTANQTDLNSLDVTIDKTVPSVTNLTLYSNNSNSSLARAGDLINITLEVSENIYNATLKILGTEIDMIESNNTAYANISVLQNSPNGLVATLQHMIDLAGNTNPNSKPNESKLSKPHNRQKHYLTVVKSDPLQQQFEFITCKSW